MVLLKVSVSFLKHKLGSRDEEGIEQSVARDVKGKGTF